MKIKSLVLSVQAQKVRYKELLYTRGTFLNGLIHIGEKQTPTDDMMKTSTGLSEQLEKFKIKGGRLKKGTPPRLDGDTINYDDLEIHC